MGVIMSDQRAQAAGLFVTKDLENRALNLAASDEAVAEFIQFIKDGSWIDLLADPDYFQMQTRGVKAKSIPVTFYSNNSMPKSPLRHSILSQSSNSVRTSSASTRDSYQSSVENFTEFYADLQERTCFSPDQMAAFLISIVYPLYGQMGERRAITEREASFELHDADFCGQDNPDITLLQELLLSVAAYFDERDLQEKIHSQDWVRTLDRAVNECSLDVCVCEVMDGGKLLPVLVNDVARKRIQAMGNWCKGPAVPGALHLWSIEHEEILQDEVQRCVTTATPLQLYSVQAFNHCRTTLQMSPVFDDPGRHRYVLGVQMDIPDDGRSVKHLQYLRDTSLLIAHVIRCAPGTEGSCEPSPNTVTRSFSS
jgi:hypothetical protein